MKKTIKNFIEYSSIDAKLIRAVVRQSGGWQSFCDMAQDIVQHVSGGFDGWSYYTETCQFYAKNQSLIVTLVEQLVDGVRYQSAQDVVRGFRGLDVALSEIEYTLYGRQHDILSALGCYQVADALARFTAEEVARSFVEWAEQC